MTSGDLDILAVVSKVNNPLLAAYFGDEASDIIYIYIFFLN